MDITQTIAELRLKKKKIDQTIQFLEGLLPSHEHPAVKRRGRKSMGPEERQQVSERIKRYWASQKRA
jgi:hypothetical protein